jgi:chromosome segregation ATPase
MAHWTMMKRPLKNEVKLVWVRQECKPPVASNSCPIKRKKKRNEQNAITLEGDLCSHKGALTGGYVYLNKSRPRAHGQQVAAQAALKKTETQHQEINRKAKVTNHSVMNLMGELQHMEAKQANFNHMISENEAEIDRIVS